MKRQRVFSRIDDSRAARDDVAVVENSIGSSASTPYASSARVTVRVWHAPPFAFEEGRPFKAGFPSQISCFLYLNENTAVFPATEASIAGSFKSTLPKVGYSCFSPSRKTRSGA